MFLRDLLQRRLFIMQKQSMSSASSENNSPRIPVRPMDGQLPGAEEDKVQKPSSQETSSILYVPPPPASTKASLPRHESSRPYMAPRPMAVPSPPRAPRPVPTGRPARTSRRRLLRRQRRLQFLAWLVSIGCVGGSFFAGYHWTKRAGLRDATLPVSAERRESAMRAMDEAVRARHEGRLDDAVLAASDAQRADPRIAGADVIAADIALVQRQTQAARQSAMRASQQGHNKSTAKLLLALSESGGMQGFSGGSDRVAALFKEAEEAELSNPAVHYVWGDMLRISGREKEAQRKLLGSLYRQEPWMSSTIIAAKLQLASVVAGEVGDLPSEAVDKIATTKAGDALVAVREALRTGGDLREPLQQLWAGVSAQQAKELLNDPVFDVAVVPPILEEARETPLPVIPQVDSSQAGSAGR